MRDLLHEKSVLSLDLCDLLFEPHQLFLLVESRLACVPLPPCGTGADTPQSVEMPLKIALVLTAQDHLLALPQGSLHYQI